MDSANDERARPDQHPVAYGRGRILVLVPALGPVLDPVRIVHQPAKVHDIASNHRPVRHVSAYDALAADPGVVVHARPVQKLSSAAHLGRPHPTVVVKLDAVAERCAHRDGAKGAYAHAVAHPALVLALVFRGRPDAAAVSHRNALPERDPPVAPDRVAKRARGVAACRHALSPIHESTFPNTASLKRSVSGCV